MRIWVTRAQPQADATAARLISLGHEPVVAPVIHTQALPISLADFAGAGALALTSQAAVAALADLVDQLKHLPVFAVGDSTKKAAQQAGFERVYSAQGNVSDLAALIAGNAAPERGPPIAGPIIHASALEPAGNLVGDLIKAGYLARRVAVYRTIGAALKQVPPSVDALMIHSAAAAKAVAGLISADQARGLRLYGLSDDAVLPLNAFNFANKAIAPFANETSILSLLSLNP